MSAAARARRTLAADALCQQAYVDLGGPDTGCCLLAVGGYGRGELAPHSDLDVVLVHADDVEIGELAEQLWYPVWDAGHRLDHSVRSASEMAKAAADDLRVAMGLLDLRHLAGDQNLTLKLRTTLLAAWRRDARRRLPELATMREQRHRIAGELAHAAVPDVKEAQGGLRDAGILGALQMTWLVDASWPDLERTRQELLDVRDQVQTLAGRASDRIVPEMWGQLAGRLGLVDAGAVQVHVRELGRRITHLSRLTWRRVDHVLARPQSVRGARRPELVRAARGVAVSRGEVVLDRSAGPAADPVLLLRAAAVAAERSLELAPATAARLARESASLPEPWPEEARSLLVRLLAAGRGLLSVWETLEETGALHLVLPEWAQLRALPHASVIHRFTVDRHVIETCIEASALIRDVSRPDLLMVAALLHDIGKGSTGDHSVVGEPVARAVATRLGFASSDVEVVALLVRRHLLLSETATTRDPEDPTTVAAVAALLPGPEHVDLLLALTEADARATAQKAWTSWRASLVRDLAARVRHSLACVPGEDPEQSGPADRVVTTPGASDRVVVEVSRVDDGSRVRVVAHDRLGLLADVAAALAMQRIQVRAARAWPHGGYGVSEWDTPEDQLDSRVLRERIRAAAEGRSDGRDRLARYAPVALAPVVVVQPSASQTATVLEVRTDDRLGVVHTVCAALSGLQLTVRSAHVSTLGPQAVDVFYVQELGAVPLTDLRAAAAAEAVRVALSA